MASCAPWFKQVVGIDDKRNSFQLALRDAWAQHCDVTGKHARSKGCSLRGVQLPTSTDDAVCIVTSEIVKRSTLHRSHLPFSFQSTAFFCIGHVTSNGRPACVGRPGCCGWQYFWLVRPCWRYPPSFFWPWPLWRRGWNFALTTMDCHRPRLRVSGQGAGNGVGPTSVCALKRLRIWPN